MEITSNTLEIELKSLQEEALKEITSTISLKDLEQLRIFYLGKKGKLSQILRGMSKLDSSKRPYVGSFANKVKNVVQKQLDEKLHDLSFAELKAKILSESLDVTMPGETNLLGNIHPLNNTRDKILDIFIGLGYQVSTGPHIETDYYNFEALNIPPDHPARDMQDTFFLTNGDLMRTHTSPVQIHYMEKNVPPIRIVAPGRVYRRDTVDSTHSAVFHQIEILAVDKGLTFTNLKGTVKEFLRQFFGEELPIKFRASYFPFTEPSIEVDVQWKGKWLEIMGCGMVDPNVLEAVGYDPEIYTGFAAGLGVERFAMVLHKIDDIRRLYTNDLRFLEQF
ncbi:phenylalanine--tRNA ligase subunit alpha [Candidatus Atelocyanobacterium thalassae]|uniref:Phenylalanine--tRNA ligase alpha subunit n=1 Tax=Atelocyanobacterium thalassa (isolate ALOHA) TaxID=1453429 RepID=D3EQU2_ATETH|nr:phenylalanine--tRNA ligase subunit alpha [Candidatus Atelocyanobacterium thalassa]ADB95842.1 phenylalanyl-tRNA synthetase, alpha subunit [Candidatus Atelocyanobacterium thalassa isolate ALOHA]MCH2543679.1 phenylalanine--tRNA ligase subunit alpha [Candidatus Atelocyanobacterium sp. ALOHA_A2.5_9]|tara:strand:+ start:31365 stop:32369 length:1005 start_codon:yes stop_codon:yes gene_type:complete